MVIWWTIPRRAGIGGFTTWRAIPGRFSDVSAKNPDVVRELEGLMLERFRATHPDAASEPQRLSRAEAIEFYLRPRDVGG